MDAYSMHGDEERVMAFGGAGYGNVRCIQRAISRAQDQHRLMRYAPLVQRVVRSLASQAGDGSIRKT
jgi:hypothetical protein